MIPCVTVVVVGWGGAEKGRRIILRLEPVSRNEQKEIKLAMVNPHPTFQDRSV